MVDKLLAPGVRIYSKDATENVTNSTTLQTDNDLLFDAPSNANYFIEGVLHVVGGDDANDDETIKVNLTVPSGATYSILAGAALSGTLSTANVTASTINGTTEGGDFVTFVALVKVGATAGTVGVQWAQNSATADGITVQIGSFIRVHPLNTRAAL